MKKYLLLTIVVVIFTAVWLSKSDPQSTTLAKTTKQVVEVINVDKQMLHENVSILGTVFAKHSVEIKPESEGKIKAIHVSSGQIVEQGMVLMELDNRHQLAVVKREQARLIDSQRQYENYKQLFPKGAVTQKLLDSAETQWLIQQAELLLAQAALQDKTIIAPFSGKVGLVDLSRGQLVTPNTILTTLDDASELRLNVPIAARHLHLLEKQQKVNLHSMALQGETIPATLTSIDSRVNSQSLNVYLQFSMDNTHLALTPGSLVTADIPLKKQAELLVPRQAIVYQGHERFVYRVEDDAVFKVAVTLGERNDESVQILSGLVSNDTVVYKGTVKLYDGAKVDIKS
ncbi:hemolysin D [Psychromonas marina]|uniref:Hemolysin D n=1 Tax=Psychromonas marina TaxID=88364 RepID=A0ABQ6E400_9GAMM|nr:efflux RND transporter periplasmic adaptor subunit [Psychromonas marina]GLS92082.1 hemolysin D [Psychromonas marina]